MPLFADENTQTLLSTISGSPASLRNAKATQHRGFFSQQKFVSPRRACTSVLQPLNGGSNLQPTSSQYTSTAFDGQRLPPLSGGTSITTLPSFSELNIPSHQPFGPPVVGEQSRPLSETSKPASRPPLRPPPLICPTPSKTMPMSYSADSAPRSAYPRSILLHLLATPAHMVTSTTLESFCCSMKCSLDSHGPPLPTWTLPELQALTVVWHILHACGQGAGFPATLVADIRSGRPRLHSQQNPVPRARSRGGAQPVPRNTGFSPRNGLLPTRNSGTSCALRSVQPTLGHDHRRHSRQQNNVATGATRDGGQTKKRTISSVVPETGPPTKKAKLASLSTHSSATLTGTVHHAIRPTSPPQDPRPMGWYEDNDELYYILTPAQFANIFCWLMDGYVWPGLEGKVHWYKAQFRLLKELDGAGTGGDGWKDGDEPRRHMLRMVLGYMKARGVVLKELPSRFATLASHGNVAVPALK